MDITAVSLKFNWTAGFNGGLKQTFAVLYAIEGSDIEHKEIVVTDPDVNKGDIIVHKLSNKETIKSNTSYLVRIQAENSFEGSSVVNGNLALFTTSGNNYDQLLVGSSVCNKVYCSIFTENLKQ